MGIIRKLKREIEERNRALSEKYRRKIEHLCEIKRIVKEKDTYRVEMPEEIECFKEFITFDEQRYSTLKKADNRKTRY